MKLKHLLLTALCAVMSLSTWAKEDVTNLLTDAELANESANWALTSNGGNHNWNGTHKYHESWHNTFTISQTVTELPAGYYEVSIQAVNSVLSSTTASLVAETSTSSSTAYIKHISNGGFGDIAGWMAAEKNFGRIYTTIKVNEGENLTIKFGQTNNAQWIVYGQFQLVKLTDAEGKNAMKLQEKVGSQNNWCTPTGKTGTYRFAAERYNESAFAAGDIISQSFANIPVGNYEVTFLAVPAEAWGKSNYGNNIAQVYAGSTTQDVAVIQTASSGYVPSSSHLYTLEASVTDGNLKVGIKNVAAGGNWYTFAVQRLTYLGADLSDYEAAFTSAKAAANGVDQNKAMNATVKSALQTAISTYAVEFSTFTEVEEVETATNALNEAAIAANTSIAYYEAVKAVIDAQAVYADNFDVAGKAAYDISAVQTAYDNGTITDGAAEIATLKATLQTAVRAQGVGGDYTAALANPDFKTDDLTGWNTNGKATPAVDVANHDCEFYEKTFDMSQEVSNLKKGTYEISFQAFQRPGGADNNLATNFINDNWTSSAILYTTAEEKNVKHICEDWQDAAQSDITGWFADAKVTPEGGTDHYIPNGMAGGRQWFDKGYYITTARAVVLEDGGSLTFGFRGQQPGGSWILFDNFTMTYSSTDVIIDEAESNKVIAEAEALESLKMTADVKTALTIAKNELSSDKTNGTKYNALKDAIVVAQASIDAYAALNSVLTNNVYIDRSAYFVTGFTYRTEAQTMYNEATAATADVNTKANGMQLAYRNYVKDIAANYLTVDGVKGARENSAWEYTTNPQNNQIYNNNVNNDLAANSMWENYKAGGLTVGDMKQTVSVPNGKYFLRMVSFTRSNPMINENDYIYIKSGENEEKSISFGESDTPNGFVNITNPIEVTNGQVEIGLHVGSGADWAAIGGVVLYAYELEATMTVNTEAKYGTFVAPYDVTIPDGVTAYTVDAVGANDVLEMTEVKTTILANTPVILNAEAGLTATKFSAKPVAGTPTEGLLTGVYKNTPAENGWYVLQNNNTEGVGFYKVDTDTAIPTVGANRCYMTVESEAAPRAFFFGGETTAIETISALVNNEVKEIYNANGVKQNSLQKGMNIIKMSDGSVKKIMVK